MAKNNNMEIVAKGVKKSKKKIDKMQKKPGGSNYGEYDNVKPSNFAGPAGGAPKFTYPINTKARAKSALSYARFAPRPSGIRKAVYKKYPDLKPDKNKKK